MVYTAARHPNERSIGLGYRKVSRGGSAKQLRMQHVPGLPPNAKRMNVHVYPASRQLETANEILLVRRMAQSKKHIIIVIIIILRMEQVDR